VRCPPPTMLGMSQHRFLLISFIQASTHWWPPVEVERPSISGRHSLISSNHVCLYVKKTEASCLFVFRWTAPYVRIVVICKKKHIWDFKEDEYVIHRKLYKDNSCHLGSTSRASKVFY
jgi:hypothetical protein